MQQESQHELHGQRSVITVRSVRSSETYLGYGLVGGVMLAQAVNRTSGRSGSASEDDPAERGCSRSRTTLG